jgi:hypothetical protein
LRAIGDGSESDEIGGRMARYLALNFAIAKRENSFHVAMKFGHLSSYAFVFIADASAVRVATRLC